MLLALGSKTKWGKVVAVGWIGERYYWMIDKYGVSMMPASVVEPDYKLTKENIWQKAQELQKK